MSTHRNHIASASLGMLAMLAGSAFANDDANLLFNPGFEEANPVFPTPLGWNGINMDSDDYVDIGDAGAFVRTGNRSLRMTPASGEGDRFKGWTTNVFQPDGSDLFDPDYVYLGGDVVVSGHYLVPDGEVIQDTIVGIKLEFRREPPNFSIWAEFEFGFPENTTGGDWIPFSFTVTDDMIQAVGDFPPDPTSVTILPFRFFGDTFGPGTSPTGTIFIDDLCVVQGGSPNCSPADLAEPFGVLNFFDISTFIGAFNAQDPIADLAAPFGSFNFFDVSTYITLYNQGCP